MFLGLDKTLKDYQKKKKCNFVDLMKDKLGVEL